MKVLGKQFTEFHIPIQIMSGSNRLAAMTMDLIGASSYVWHWKHVVVHHTYPAISNLVEQTCQEFGVRYGEHTPFSAGLSSHFRWLRRMGARTAGGPEFNRCPQNMDQQSDIRSVLL